MIIDRLPLLTNPTTGDEIPVERGQNCYKIDYSDLKGEQGPAGPAGPEGPAGPSGPAGATGATPNLTVGTVTTLPAGSNATVTITGTTLNPVLNFGIPKGRDGSGGLTPIDDAVVTLTSSSFTYDGTTKTQTVQSVVLNGTTLTEGDDYIVTNNTATDAGTHTLVVAGNGNYTGEVTANWSIAVRKYPKPTVTAHPTYTGSAQSPTLSGYVPASMTQTGDTQATNAGSYTLTISLNDTTNNAWSDNTTSAVNLAWHISKASGSVSVSPNSLSISTIGDTATATIATTGDGTVSVSSGATGVATATLSGTTITVTAMADGTAAVTVTLAEGNNYLGATASLSVSVQSVTPEAGVYGASWDKSSSTVLTRTDAAANFSNPSPAVAGGNGSSPFDSVYPWSDIRRVTIQGNEMVEIPKFYFKWTDESGSLKLQISPTAKTGYHISPAHADRGDGVGERDVVYVGRYHCDSSYGSTTGVTPLANITRATARTGCEALGDGFHQLDYAMLWTIRMLYLVEYADWDSQKVIGFGRSPSSAKFTMGYTDNMTYHTGTSAASRDTYGGTQYRYIEGLWDNVYDWCDGIVLNSRNPYSTLNPANYGDSTTNHTQVGTGPSSNGDISGWNVPTTSGLEWALFPNATISDSTYTTYCADNCGAGGVVVFVGGYYGQDRGGGMFFSGSYGVSSTYDYFGARLQYLPPASTPTGGIYGVSWDKSSSTVLSRTDDAALFTDPVPAVAGGNGSSPFDTIAPWSGMVRETVDGNAMVKIPKFYYKWTDDTGSLKLQISPTQQTGFHVSPAHADRGDGNGEREYVYVGRYHCGSDYTSKTGVMPLGSITRATARTSCANLGTGYYQLDYAMLWTIRMLYLVEYADWDCQKVIGFGRSPSGSIFTMGYTDSMTYHTGTDAASRDTYGGTQYRYIEGLWDNVYDWCDGIVLYSHNPYVTLNPANYGDSTTNHTQVGTGASSYGCISDWSVPTTSGFEWALCPSATNGSDYTVYCADFCSALSTVVYAGSNRTQGRSGGIFVLGSDSVSASYDYVCARLQKLP